MSTPQGREWFYDLLVACHIFSDPFTGDALWEAHNKGERNIGLRIYADIMSFSPDQFILMMREADVRTRPEPGSHTDDTGASGYDTDYTSSDDTE